MNTSIEPIVQDRQALIVPAHVRQHEPMVQELDARQTFSARLHQALGALGLPVRGRATWLHERTGLSKKAAGKWLNAEAMPETKRIEGLAKLLNVDARWLLSGQGVAPEDDNEQPSRQTTLLPEAGGEAPALAARLDALRARATPRTSASLDAIAAAAAAGRLNEADLALLHTIAERLSKKS